MSNYIMVFSKVCFDLSTNNVTEHYARMHGPSNPSAINSSYYVFHPRNTYDYTQSTNTGNLQLILRHGTVMTSCIHVQ